MLKYFLVFALLILAGAALLTLATDTNWIGQFMEWL